MTEVGCNGDEESLLQCPYKGPYNNDCYHNEDVGVLCGTFTEGIVFHNILFGSCHFMGNSAENQPTL